MGPNKICVQKSVDPKEIFSKKCWYIKMLGPQKFVMPNNVWSKEIICPKISFIIKLFYFEKECCSKSVGPKIWECKKLWVLRGGANQSIQYQYQRECSNED